MDIEIKPLKEPFPCAEIAKLYEKTYFQEYLEAGALMWNEKYARFYFGSITFDEEAKKYIFGAYDGDKLVGTIVGNKDEVILDNELELCMVNFGLLAVYPEYRRRGVAKSLVSKLIDSARREKIDFVMAFPEKGRLGDSLLKEHFDFKSYAKAKHLIKLMEETGLQALRDYMNRNPVLVKLASLYSHIPEELGKPDGMIRDGRTDDYAEVIKIINSYRTRLPLAEQYSIEGFKKSNERLASTMNKIFGDPWNFHWLVLERKKEILATLNYRIEMATFQPEGEGMSHLPVSLLTTVAFKEDLELDQKIKFINYVLRKIRTDLPNVFITQITTCQHEMKPFRKLKFPSDQSIYYLYMLPLTSKGEELNRYNNYKEFFLNYYR